MGSVSIRDIIITPLKRIPVEGGDVLHGLKSTEPSFVGFGEVYFSTIEKGKVKGWKRHQLATLNLVVPFGSIKFDFIDNDGCTLTHIVGPHSYVRLTIPPLLWFRFKGMVSPYSLLMNVSNLPHDPEEVDCVDINHFDFNWES